MASAIKDGKVFAKAEMYPDEAIPLDDDRVDGKGEEDMDEEGEEVGEAEDDEEEEEM
jgi:hypothetical protein